MKHVLRSSYNMLSLREVSEHHIIEETNPAITQTVFDDSEKAVAEYNRIAKIRRDRIINKG